MMSDLVKMLFFILSSWMGPFLTQGVSGFETDEVSAFVMVGDSVTLQINVETNQEARMKWYLNDTRIAQVSGGLSQTCTDNECKERFRDRLKVDHQTGSLTITNIRSSDTGVYKLQTIRRRIVEEIFNVTVLDNPDAVTNKMKTVSVKGESVTLHPGVRRNPGDAMSWYFNHTLIAEITGDQSQICTDDGCKERFRDGLKVDPQTGSLTITNTTTTDSGEYQLKIINSIHHHNRISIITTRRFNITVTGASDFDEDRVSVKEGDSVSLHSDVKAKKQDRIRWYFNDARIAQVSGGLIQICTDEECKERFGDRLKVDRLTGDLTITNTTSTDSGVYQLQIIRRRVIEKTFNVTVLDVSPLEQDEMKRVSVMAGESVTLDPHEIKNPSDVMVWYFDDVCIAEITEDRSHVCTDDQCKERFRRRLKVDHQTGSLTITNARNEHSGLYKLQVIHSIRQHHSIISLQTFSVDVADSNLTSSLTAGGCAFIVALLIAVAYLNGCCCKGKKKNRKKKYFMQNTSWGVNWCLLSRPPEPRPDQHSANSS